MRSEPTDATSDLVGAERIADEVLSPQRGEVDRSGRIPSSHFDILADAGLYGAASTMGTVGFSQLVETLARGCLATTFVWMQHHGLARRLASESAPEHLRSLGEELHLGRARAGIVQAGLLPGRPLLTARADPADGTWRLDGISPWCTGWGMVDHLLVAARITNDLDTVAWFLVDARVQPGLDRTRLSLQAVDATATVSLTFDALAIEPSRFLGTDDYGVVGHAAGSGLRSNGSLALGLANRCAARIEAVGTPEADDRAGRLAQRIDQMRADLDAADDAAMPARRADAALLAVAAAVALVAAQGAAAAIRGSEGEQAMREATFLLVFGSRPAIKQELLLRS